MGARVFQLNVSGGGVPKRPVASAQVGPLGLDGDAVDHPRIHGGPERALCLYALERILALQQEGHPVFPGALGENVTVMGVDWDLVAPGSRWSLGDVAIEVTRYTTPCSTTAPFVSGDLKRFHQDHSPGWSRVYAKVLTPGRIAPGDAVSRL